MNEEKIRYKAFAFRLNKDTEKNLRQIRRKEEVSWNLLFYNLIKTYEQHGFTKEVIRRKSKEESNNKGKQL